MAKFGKPILQVALDLVELERAIQIAREAVEGGVDWIEAGTPLIKSEGMDALRKLREEFPDRKILADMKTIDTGALEVEMAGKSGASIVMILAISDNSTLREAIKAGRKYGVELMADLINTPDPLERAKELEKLGIDYINVHVGIDQQMVGRETSELLEKIVDEVSIPLAVAGGLDAITAAECVSLGADIVIVGSNIVKSADVRKSARAVRKAIDEASGKGRIKKERKDIESEIRDILMRVSTPNISDAMHRQPPMSGIKPMFRGIKMVGRAVTVQSFEGDWAKPVEAIDVAGKGDVIVIYCPGKVAPWGALASRSCKNKGIAGVVIDGPVRDIEEIEEINFPVFARDVVPNAGEPKGFGEINSRIICGGIEVKPGDWIVGDDNGVMVIPKERAYEIARRSLEVSKHEERVREEIKRGRTLAEITELYKWEKK